MKNLFHHSLKRFSARLIASIFIVGLVLALGPQAIAQTGEPPRQPMLRIETGMHTATIWRIGVDAANRFLVTASADKTVRVWDIPSGRLTRILYPPIGAGNDGKLYSVAISPDGQTVAAGGWTGYDWDKTHSIYIFDRKSGRLTRRILGLPNVIIQLAFSRDGRYLAAMLHEKNGVRLYQTTGYTQVGEDRDYGSTSNGADFDAANRLVTTSYDGFIRLYEVADNAPPGRALRLIAKQKLEGDSKPYDIRFSPDGSRIAVGFFELTKVNVLNGSDLSLLYAPEVSRSLRGDLFTVAWSANGNLLYAGGRAILENNRKFIRAWTNGGRGSFSDILLDSTSTIFHIYPLRDGGFVYGAGDPAFGVVDASGRQALFTPSGIADYRNNAQGFLLSDDGSTVQFGYEQFGKSLARFSQSERRVELLTPSATGSTVGLHPPTVVAKDMVVTDWYNTYEPKVNKQPLKLEQYEMARSLAVTPDASAFLLGTEFYMRLFDRTGKQRWQVDAPGPTWCVNISSDGRLAVAAYGDGTIRWYRMTDGRELLAFFPHRDQRRWVAWTTAGYYDASPGAEGLIGWHINNGSNQAADFFPASQFRNIYYRPDVTARVLKVGDETRALDIANQENGRKQQEADLAKQLPPVVEIISPADGSEIATSQITVSYRIRMPSKEPVTGLKALVDGRPTGARGLVIATTSEETRTIQITLPERDSIVSLIAENRFSESVPATVRLKWRGGRPADTATASSLVKPRLYVLAVGVSRYANAKFNLKFPDKDAGDFIKEMQTQKGLLYRDVVVKSLLNEQATKDEVLDGLDWIRKETTSNDVAMVFFAGHGINDQNNYYYFCPYNVDPERMLRTGVAFSDIKNAISAIAGKALFFVDTCHSGNSLGLAPRRSPLDINIVINELSSAQNGVVVFSASTGSESSYERDEWNNGAFTKALIEGLGGAADLLNKRSITYQMLNLYIADRVKELTKGQQHPTMISPQTVPDFPIAVKK
jgi:WD40 repeat protein